MSEQVPLEICHSVPLPGGVPMNFRRIVDRGETAEFRMGSRGFSPGDWYKHAEEPAHRVVIARPYYLGVVPVTQAQYAAMAAIMGSLNPNPSHFEGSDRPVEQVSWEDCVAVCEWLTRSGLLPPGWSAELPSEALWEYACRAGTETEYSNGDGEESLAEVGWFDGNSGNETHPVGEKKANDFDLHDMHGNVWEWCADVFDAKAYRKRVDGWEARAWDEDDAGDDAEYLSDEDRAKGTRNRVVRGGSWLGNPGNCRSAIRFGFRPGVRFGDFGFRVCLFPDPVVPAQPSKSGAGVRSPGKEGRRSQGGASRRSDGDLSIDLEHESLPPRSGRQKI